MKTKYILVIGFSILCSYMLMAQSNLISNSDLESALCGDSQGDNCDHFHDCVLNWTITHGTPNYTHTDCGENSWETDHHIQLVSNSLKSEGVMTSVDLQPGCHELYLRVRVVDSQPGANVRLRITLDHGLEPWSELACQQIIPNTEHTTFIYNDFILENNGDWQWVKVDFGIDWENSFLDQLMITGLTDGGQVIFHIDCIYMYRNCEESLLFTSPPNTQTPIPNGIHNSCSNILVEAADGGQLTVPAYSDVTLNAADYIRILPGFHAKHKFRASMVAVCSSPNDGFLPDCFGCEPDDNGGGGYGGGGGGGGKDETLEIPRLANEEAAETLTNPIVFPNPSSGLFTVNIPAGYHELKIYNLLGEQIYEGNHKTSVSIDASDWSKSIYLVEVKNRSASEKKVVKLIIQ